LASEGKKVQSEGASGRASNDDKLAWGEVGPTPKSSSAVQPQAEKEPWGLLLWAIQTVHSASIVDR
jgi:hypothetical protein